MRTNNNGPKAKMLHTKVIYLLVLEKFSQGFYHIWTWRLSLSCDSDAADNLLFLLPMEAIHKL